MEHKKRKYNLFWLIFIIFIGILLVIWFAFQQLAPQAIVVQENTNKNSINITDKQKLSVIHHEPEYLSSFSDLFSGTAWLDLEQTNLTRDQVGMVFTFKPNIEWQFLGDCSIMESRCQEINVQPTKQQFCLNNKAQNCLEIKNKQLIYQQRPLILPISDQERLVNLTVESFADRWLIAAVQKITEEQYQPKVWWFDGYDFKEIKLLDDVGKTVVSKYLGQMAIGGRTDSILILYSADDGLAWQVNGSEVRELSHFFGLRVNGGGFAPKIVYLGQGQDTVWYVFDQAGQQARLIKFWHNGTSWIEGGVDLTASLPSDSQAVYLTADSNNNLTAKIIAGTGQASLWLMLDHGFIAPSSSQVTSVNLTVYDRVKPQIVGAVVAGAVGGWSGLANQWSLSTDGDNWQSVQLGQRLNFQQPVSQLWWRWQVQPNANAYLSPCLKMITINYYRL